MQNVSISVLSISKYSALIPNLFQKKNREKKVFLSVLQFQRQSTEGTSFMLFALAMMGNGTYGLSVIVVLPALKGSKQNFIIKHLAWLISSTGVLILDFFVSFSDRRLCLSDACFLREATTENTETGGHHDRALKVFVCFVSDLS